MSAPSFIAKVPHERCEISEAGKEAGLEWREAAEVAGTARQRPCAVAAWYTDQLAAPTGEAPEGARIGATNPLPTERGQADGGLERVQVHSGSTWR